MEQTEKRKVDVIGVEVEFTLREKLKILFSKKVLLNIDLSKCTNSEELKS